MATAAGRAALVSVTITALAVLAGCASNGGGSGELKTASDVTAAEKRAAIRLQLAVGYYQNSQYETALDEVKQAIAADPDNAEAHGLRALIYTEMGQMALADENYRTALRLKPGNPDLSNNYGSFLCTSLNKPAQAMPYFDTALRNPAYQTPMSALVNAGLCSIRSKNFQAAERYLLDALRYNPDLQATNAGLARIYYERREYPRAGFFISRLIETSKLDTLSADALWLALRVQRKLGDRTQEASLAAQLRRRFPGSPEYAAFERGAFDEETSQSETSNMNEHADQPATPGNDAGIPGKTLQSQREAMGWSVEQVADQLKLAPRQVVALEAGDYASLPSPAVTRGFVRAYAKLLRIDAAPLVAKIEMNMPPEAQAGATASIPRREQRPASFSQSRFPIGGKRNKVPVGLIAGVAVAVAAGAALWHFGLLPGSEQLEAGSGAVLEAPVVVPNGATPAGQDPLLNPSVPLISVPAPAVGGAAAPASGAPAGTMPPAAAPATAPGTTPPSAAAPATLAAPVTAVPATSAAAPAAAPAAAGGNALVLSVREDAWIGVVVGGKRVLWREVKAGSTETVDVTGPATLTVGNPGAVTATLRGSALSLAQAPDKKFAQVSLK